MKTFTLLVAFAAVYVAVADAGVVKRQADKARRIVRVRGRQREDRQLFFEPLPLAAPQPILIPSAAPLAQPIQVVEIRQQPQLQLQPQPVELIEVREAPAAANYGGPVVEVKAAEPNYAAPEPEVVETKEAEINYEAPEAVEVVSVREEEPLNNYGAVVPQQFAAAQIVEVRQPAYTVPQTIATERLNPARPIAITRSVYNAPGARAGNDNWDYAFESENGIKQEAVGQLKLVGDSDVVVMRGSYEYIGADNIVYVVEWEADENGFRASAPHLPKSVPIPFPEQQDAVDAQLRFAAEEDALALRVAASEALPSYAPLPAYAN